MPAPSHDRLRRIADRANALSDPTRIRILYALERAALPVGRIAAVLSSQPSTISKHLQVLFREGLVTRQRSASFVIYGLAHAELLDWCRYLAGRHIGSRS